MMGLIDENFWLVCAACGLSCLLLGWFAHSVVWGGELADWARVNEVADWNAKSCQQARYEPVRGRLSLVECHQVCENKNYSLVGPWRKEVCVCLEINDC